MNSSFYRLPKPEVVARRRAVTAVRFVCAFLPPRDSGKPPVCEYLGVVQGKKLYALWQLLVLQEITKKPLTLKNIMLYYKKSPEWTIGAVGYPGFSATAKWCACGGVNKTGNLKRPIR